MYKTLENYSHGKKKCGNCRKGSCVHYPFETYQRDIAQQNRQLQSLAHTAKYYAYQKASGIITSDSNLTTHGYLDYRTKDNFCSKN